MGMKNKGGSFESRWYRLKSSCLDFWKKFSSIIIVISMAFACLLTIGIFISEIYFINHEKYFIKRTSLSVTTIVD